MKFDEMVVFEGKTLLKSYDDGNAYYHVNIYPEGIFAEFEIQNPGRFGRRGPFRTEPEAIAWIESEVCK